MRYPEATPAASVPPWETLRHVVAKTTTGICRSISWHAAAPTGGSHDMPSHAVNSRGMSHGGVSPKT